MSPSEFRALNKWALPTSWIADNLGSRRVSDRTVRHWVNGRAGVNVTVPDDVVDDLRKVNDALDHALLKIVACHRQKNPSEEGKAVNG